MKQTTAVAGAYDALAENYASENWGSQPSLPSLKKFAASLPVRGRVLDAGCGAGQDAYYLHRRGFKVTGVEPSRELLKIARKKVAGVKFMRSGLEEAPLKPATFDGVWCNRVFQHVRLQDQRRFLNKIRRCLKGGGRFYLSLKIAPRRSRETVKIEDNMRFPVVFTTLGRLASLLNRAGFTIERKAAWDVGQMWEFYCRAV